MEEVEETAPAMSAEAVAALEERVLAAQDAYFQGDYAGAVNAAKTALLQSPIEADAYEILTMALMQQRHFDLAAEAASVWAEVAPDNLQQLALRLQSAYMAGDLDLCGKAAEAILRPESRLTAMFPSRVAIHSAESGERTRIIDGPGPVAAAEASMELQLLARCFYHDLRREQDLVNPDAATAPESFMHISTDPDHDPAADPTAGELTPMDQVVRLWGIACEQGMEDVAVQALAQLAQTWMSAETAESKAALDLALSLLGTVNVDRSELEQARSRLSDAANAHLDTSPNLQVLWALIEIESLPEEPPSSEASSESSEQPDAAVVARREAIGTALLKGAAGAHWLLRRRAQRFLA